MQISDLSTGRFRQFGNGRSELMVERASYGPHGTGAQMSYAITPSPFGDLLVAATARGICWIGLHASAAYLEAELRCDFTEAGISGDGSAAPEYGAQVVASITDPTILLDLPLDIRATPFQLSVWRELCAIPRGATRSYGEMARRLGRPDASRAVGHANGLNPVAIIVPCHRVIGSNGALTGYRWGVGIKRRLLEAEGALVLPSLAAAS